MDNLSIEAKISSLTNLQGIINRFSDTSSKLKGIYITVMSALLTVAITYILPKQSSELPFMYTVLMSLIFFVVFFCFLSVDRTFLYYERIMRRVYDCKANDKKANGQAIDNYFEITSEFKQIKDSKKVSKKPSGTQWFFYGVPLIIFEISILIIGIK